VNAMMIGHLTEMSKASRDLRHKRYLMAQVKAILEDRSGEIDILNRTKAARHSWKMGQ